MTMQLAPVQSPMLTGTENDIRTVEAVLARLRPRCPRCMQAEFMPLTWGEHVIWFQCARCYKLWRQDVDTAAVLAPGVAIQSAA